MRPITASQVVRRPPKEVFGFVALDYARNHPRWDPMVTGTVNETGGAVRLGTRFVERRRLLGFPVNNVVDVTEFESDRGFSVRTTGGPIKRSVRWFFEPIPEGTHLRVSWEGTVGSPLRVLEGSLLARAQAELESALANVKQLLESPSSK